MNSRRQGAAFMMALGLLLLLSATVTLVLPVLARRAEVTRTADLASQALDLAVAGTEAAIAEIAASPEAPKPVSASLDGGSYSATITKEVKSYTIVSTGTVEGVSRTVERIVSVSDDPNKLNAFERAVFGGLAVKLTDTVGVAGWVKNGRTSLAVHSNTGVTITNVSLTGALGDSSTGTDPLPLPSADMSYLSGKATKYYYSTSAPISNVTDDDYAGKIIYSSGDIVVDLSVPDKAPASPSDNTVDLGEACLIATGDILVKGGSYKLIIKRIKKLPVMVAGGKVIFTGTASVPVSYTFGKGASAYETTVGTGPPDVTGTIYAAGGIEIDHIHLTGILLSRAAVTVSAECEITYEGKDDYFTRMNVGLRLPAGRIRTVAWKR